MLTGEPLFPGDSDIDQLYHIVKCFGNLTPRHKEVFLRNPLFVGMRLPEVREISPLEKKFTRISPQSLELMKQCLRLDPDERPTCTQLIKHDFFSKDNFTTRFQNDLKQRIERENQGNPLKTPSDKDDDDSKGNKKKKKADNNKDSKASEDKKKKVQDNEKTVKKAANPNTVNGTGNVSLPGPSNQSKNKSDSSVNEAKVDIKDKKSDKNDRKPEDKSDKKSGENKRKSEETSEKKDGKKAEDHKKSDDKVEKSDDKQSECKENEKDKENNKDSTVSAVSSSSIPPINSSGHTVHVSTPPSMPAISRVSDKMVKKPPPNLSKKTPITSHHSTTLSPQPLQSERSFLHDKVQEKMKAKSPDKREKEFITLPEVKGAEAHPTKTKLKQNHSLQRSSVATIPHITNIDPFSGTPNDAQSSDGKEGNLPNV